MADVTITIPNPVLVGAEKFKTRYRTVPGAFGSNTDRTNAAFTLTGLTVGQYELEVIFVTEEGIECPAKLQTFEVIEIDDEDPEDPFECSEFAAEIRQNGALYYVHITYPIPIASTPSCGWEIYSTQSVNSVIPYTTLPNSGYIDIPITGNFNTGIGIVAKICGGGNYFCFEEQVPKIPEEEVTCEQLFLSNAMLVPSGMPGEYTLNLDLSSTATGGNITILFSETSPLIPFGSGISGTYVMNFPPMTIGTFPFTGIFPIGHNYECIKLEGKIIDFCENEIPFCVTYSIGGIPCFCP